jgi:hypothetical protein
LQHRTLKRISEKDTSIHIWNSKGKLSKEEKNKPF